MVPIRTTCHAKVILVDNSSIFIGSHNLAKSSFRNPMEVSIESHDPGACKKVEDWFIMLMKDPGFTYYPAGKYNIPDIYP